MAENENGQEKSEPATARKRGMAREEGNVPKSMDLNTTVMLIAGVISFYFLAGYYFGRIGEAIRYYLQESAYVITDESAHALMVEIALRILVIVAPFFTIFVATALITNLFQVGFLVTPAGLKPKLDKLNPIKGIKRFVSMRTYMELLKSVMKILIIAPVMISTVWSYMDELPDYMNLGVLESMIQVGYCALDVAIRAIIILVILSLIDYIYQRWQHERDLKMTKEEVKQEMKDVQGDPIIKSRIRSIQQEMARKRMMQEVPEADVVVTNPTEYAIALKYKPGETPAPLVIAKGRGEIARRIRELAIDNSVPLVENRLLAQSLYKLVEVGGIVPPELYQAVAEVLAYVYRLNNKQYQTA